MKEAKIIKQFREKLSGHSIHVYGSADEWFVKHTNKRQRIKDVQEFGPFKTEGDALLACCTSNEFKFSNYSQVYP